MTGRPASEKGRAAPRQTGRAYLPRPIRRGFKRPFTKIAAFHLAIMAAVALAAVLLAFPRPPDYNIGRVAEYTVRADHSFRFLDRAATENRKLEAERQVPPVFLLDDIQAGFLENRAAAVFRQGRAMLARDAGAAPEGPDAARLREEFEELFSLPPGNDFWPEVLAGGFDESLERRILGVAMEIMALGLLGDIPELLPEAASRPATVITLSNRLEYTVPRMDQLMDQLEMDRRLGIQARRLSLAHGREEIRLILALARGLIRPNLTFNENETKARVWRASGDVRDVYMDVRPGEVIIQEGMVIGPVAFEKIKAMQTGQFRGAQWLSRLAGLFLALLIFYGINMSLTNMTTRATPASHRQATPTSHHLFIASALILTALAANTAILFGTSISWDFDYIDNHTIFYAVPFPAAAMLAGIFLGLRKAMVTAVMVTLTAAAVIPSEGRLLMTLYVYNGSIIAALCLRNMNERKHLIPASLSVMAVNGLTILALTLFNDTNWGRHTINNFLAAAAGGLLSGVLASGLIPLAEMVFGFNTAFKLLELGNLDRPILRELMLSAPGTYHHSVIVGTMVEAAAEAIGVNPHLAKVGAYYHDIGKMKKPLYFVENQSGENRHDTLAPSMSALVLVGHIREGTELARAHRLPQSIIDIIEQHHGVSLMGFFYHKAKEQHQAGQPEVNEGDFRYPGPKPRSAESGLVMLGDICEAATRSLAEPAPAKIKNLVRLLVNQVFSDGQLDECDLKTYDIPIIINIFTTILVGIYHQRVAYPGTTKKLETTPAAEKNASGAQLKEPAYGHLPVEPPKGATH